MGIEGLISIIMGITSVIGIRLWKILPIMHIMQMCVPTKSIMPSIMLTIMPTIMPMMPVMPMIMQIRPIIYAQYYAYNHGHNDAYDA